MCEFVGSKILLISDRNPETLSAYRSQKREQQMPCILEASDHVRSVVVSYCSRKFCYGGSERKTVSRLSIDIPCCYHASQAVSSPIIVVQNQQSTRLAKLTHILFVVRIDVMSFMFPRY